MLYLTYPLQLYSTHQNLAPQSSDKMAQVIWPLILVMESTLIATLFVNLQPSPHGGIKLTWEMLHQTTPPCQ